MLKQPGEKTELDENRIHPITLSTKPNPNSLPGFWEPKVIPNLQPEITVKTIAGFNKSDVMILENVFSAVDCEELIKFMNSSQNFEEVGVQGMKDKKDTRIGSMRTSIWSPGTAQLIWNKIKKFIGPKSCDELTLTDWWQGIPQHLLNEVGVNADYLPVAVSPLLRFMKYGHGGQHYAHYDAGFIYPLDQRFRTLKSMVIYLTTNDNAATRFIRDTKNDLVTIWDRNHEDWNRPVKDEEVIGKSECVQGNILLFDHRICHDVEQYMGDEQRVIIRGDIVYKQVN